MIKKTNKQTKTKQTKTKQNKKTPKPGNITYLWNKQCIEKSSNWILANRKHPISEEIFKIGKNTWNSVPQDIAGIKISLGLKRIYLK